MRMKELTTSLKLLQKVLIIKIVYLLTCFEAIRFDLMTLPDLEEVISKDIMVIGSAKVTEAVAQVIKNKKNNCVPCGNMRGAESLVITGGSVPIIDEFKGGIYDGEDHHVYDNSVVALHPKASGDINVSKYITWVLDLYN